MALLVRRLWPLALLSLAACVGPARSYDAYSGKAGVTAEDMRSAVESARLAVVIASKDNALAPWLSVTLADAEDDASAVQGAFDSIQPPDPRSDRLREQLDGLLSAAVDTLTKLRIHVRRGELAALPGIARPLGRLSDRLDGFARAHE